MASQVPPKDIKMDAPPLTEEELNSIYNWVDEIPLTRPKKNITRDFADGCMVAEIVNHYFPKLIEIHNYSLAHSVQQKLYNWNTLNQKVFKKMGFQISKKDIDHIVSNSPDAIERENGPARQSNSIDYGQQNEYQPPVQQYQQPNNQIQQQYQNQAPKGGPANRNQNINPQQYQFNEYINPKDVKELLQEKDNTINELRQTIEILELKNKKVDQLIKLKDSKIQTLINKLAQYGGGKQ